MYNFTQYSKNHRKTTRGLWNYSRDEPNIPLKIQSRQITKQVLQEN